ncbi:hypothetical protein MJC1_02786 [Methylocystis sp. MJC1]|jgi:hypothetical protein|nr:hypothetical protein MJC1_02786 [Methylocystis sp. MJC1]
MFILDDAVKIVTKSVTFVLSKIFKVRSGNATRKANFETNPSDSVRKAKRHVADR